MAELDVLRIVSVVLSNLNFVISMLLIVFIAICFMGRYVEISKKMVFMAFGVLAVEALLLVFFSLSEISIKGFLHSKLDALVESPEDISVIDSLALLIQSFAINFCAFAYAFVFFMISFKKRRFIRSLGAVLGIYVYYMYIETIVMYTFVYFSGGDPETLLSLTNFSPDKEASMYVLIYQIIVFVVTSGLLALLYFGYYKRKRFYVLRPRNRVFFILWILLFAFVPMLAVNQDTVESRYGALSFVFGILIPLMGVIGPMVLVMTAAEKNLKDKVEYQESYLKTELEYIDQYKKNQMETRAFRHDIINNLSLMDMMMSEGKTEEASKHLKELLGSVQALSPQYVTGDEMLDGIVSMKAGKMLDEGIKFTLDGVVDGGLKMSPMDICGIFANALDNALEAASQTKPDAWVNMEIKRTEKFFIIRIQNSVKETVDVQALMNSDGYSSKNDREHHGFGLSNIKATVGKYDGMLKAESEGGEFILSIMIPRS